MELAIPLVALGGLYIISNNQSPNNDENYREGMQDRLPSNTQEENNISVINKLNNDQVNDDLINQQDEYLDINNKSYKDDMYKKYTGQQTTDNFFDSKRLIEPIFIENSNYLNKTNSNHQSLTGDNIDINNFNHNNMQPFYRSKTMQDSNLDKVESILDNKIGSGSLINQKKTTAPLFEPSENLHYANGMPNMNDFMQSRVVPGQKISNVLPFDKKMVGPGLDQGYGTEGNNGFNSGMMSREKWMPKDVDELRVATNPKITYTLDGHQGPANSFIKNRGQHAFVEKNRPDRFYETSGKSSWFTTVGEEKAQTARSLATVHSNIKETTSSPYEGIARGPNKDNLGNSVYRESHRIQLGSENFGIADAGGEQPATPNDYGIKSFNITENNRTANSSKGKFGGVGGALGAVVAPLMDMLRPSRKENIVGNVRLYGDLKSEVPQSYINNPNDTLRTTNRQMVKDSDMYYNVQAQNQGSYAMNSQELSGNQRDTTQMYYVGNAGGDGVSNSMTTYDTAYNQNNNETKEKLVKNRANQGGTQIFNQHENILISKNDKDRENNRMWIPSNASAIPPSSQTYGKLDQPMSYMEEKNNYDRINPNLLNAFKQNPYTHSLNNSV
tara:strand:+ start:26036 stop:27877 length:1842 start_codon:yes stop_codon:yes gene_type:complete